ncbi:glycoside hydrolase family 88 protein [uncultured Prevotella sp.]|uniref:glycoside hydrolase family 88 protein n=1 Tax=uncultured Prevotella sp. TaxID=159272 RepID=UPI00261F0059|nr:glycoside hydrolase family 88 protein [uncultured Prevotella sp.]
MRISKLCSGGKGISLRHGKQLLRCLPLVGMLLATSSVNAADSPGVKFNSGVRYSQWAINSRLYDFRGNQKAYGFASWDATNGKGNYANKSNMKIDYVAGLVGKATLEASDYYSSFDWAKPWFKSAEAYATDYKYSAQDQAKMTLDNMNAAKMALHIVNNKWASDNAKTTASAAITAIINDLKYYNENYVIGGTKSDVKEATANDVQKKMLGGWFHKYNYVDQVWCDGMYMGPALLAQLINYKDASSKVSNDDWSLLTKQFTITWEQLRDAKTGLMYHGMTATPTTTDWSKATDATSYHSGAFWGRANAWYMLALVDVLEVMPSNNANYSMLKGYLENLAASIASYQNEDGTWYQVLDQKDNALNGNYEESSCSALFTAAYLKAIRLNLLDSNKYETMAKKAYVALVDKFMSYDKNDNSKIQILSSCCSAGLGTNNNSLRDGSRSYYITGKDSKAVTGENTGFYYTEGKVLGGFIMAATEYERAYQNQDTKQILFAKDLAPQYDFSTTAGSLDATAYGEGTITYQWYKDNGTAVANATSATFSPKESGDYYCTASDGKNTIKTSTTTVKAKAATEGGDTSGETTATSGKATFATDHLISLDSAPTVNETSELVDGNITIKAGKKISWDTKNNGLKIGKKDQSTFSIIANNNAKIKKVIITQTDNNRELNYNPAGSKSPNDKVFTYDYSKTKPSEITVSYNTGGNIYVTNIVVEYENEIVKTDLTASFSQSTIDATEGDASVDVPALTVKVKAGNKVFTDYTATYTTTDANVAKVENGKVVFGGKGTTTISVNVTPNDATLYNDCTAEFTVNVKEKTVPPVDPTETTNVYDFKTGVGTTKSGNTAIEVTTDNIVFGANYKPKEGKYITITPKDGGFKVGDVITIKGTSTKGNALMTLNSTLDSETSEQYQFNALGTTETTRQYILQADCPVLYLGRASGSTATITGLTVTRAAAAENKTRLVATFPSNSITVVNTTATVELPELTVKAGDIELTNKQYTVKKESDNPAVATISGDEITINGIGTATIFAIITPIDQKNYEGCTATYQVTVKEPTPLAISTMDVTINTIDAEVKQPIIKVYGDNDKLLTLGKDYTLTYIVEGSNVTVDDAGVFSVTGSAYNWRAGTSKVTVTATPTTALGDTYKEGTLTFEYNVVKGKITPVFHEAFNDATIRVKTDTKKDKTFSVPLIYDGEDVSEYFDYTYTINGRTPVEIDTNNKVSGDTLTFRPAANGTYTIKVTAKPNTGKVNDDADDYSQVYNEPVGISFTVNVGDFTRPTVTVNPSTMTMYTGTFESAADVTVMNGKDIIPDNEYKLAWRSFTPGIVKVDADGNIEAVSEGNGDIRVSVYGDKFETMTATIKVYVDDPALYRAKTKDNDGKEVKYGNQRVMWNQDKTMSVSLGGWMFPNDVTVTNETTTEALSSKNKWEDAASLAKWKLTGFDHVVLSDASQNARQENGSNAMPESTDLYNAKFENKGTVVDKMFNVPCTGSYLAFNPATNGFVRVHIFQSGAFDSANKKNQYRPQRRVFVMDEAGNFVESRAEIENANGKPKGGVKALSKYQWDLNEDAAPTLEEVRKHFPKLPTSFAMTDTGFQNNVMESGLDKSLVHNNVPDGKSGANGWCVLADSPVTYSFRVKAGKTYYLYNFGSKIGFYGYSFEEDETKPVVDEITYDDDKINDVKATEDGHVAKVTINRKFTKGIWTTCVLPFSLNKHQVDAIFGTTYGLTNDGTTTNENVDGTQILYFDHVAGNKAYFVRHAYNTIVAGKPFLIKPAKDVESINTAAVTDYPYVTIENTQPAYWCASNEYAWVSSYSNDMTVKEGDCFISNKDGHFKNFVGDSGTLKGFRGYLRANLANGAKPQTLSVGMDSNVNEEGTSAIIGLTIDADGNIVTGVADGKVYNVNGQVVSEDSRNFGALPSGVYVINGKKYVK